MKYPISHTIFLMALLFQLGCSSSSEEQTLQQVSQVEAYSDLSDLTDENSVAMKKIKEIEDSNDPQLDQESSIEIKSAKDKIIIAGDSWGSFSCLYNSMGKMIRDVGAKIIEDNRCLRTTKLGMRASDWVGSPADQRTTKFLKNTPRIKYLYLSLGGNDLMGSWNKDFTPQQEFKLFDETYNTIQKIMDNYLAIRPDLKIILSGYDFPHFKPNHKIPLYKNIYEKMGSPSPLRINRALASYSRFMAPIANGKNIFYIHHLGLSQYYDGVPENNFPSKRTLSPDQISTWDDPSVIGGDINFPSSESSMINWLFLVHDAFHLNTKMYRNVMHHTYNNVLSHIIQ